MGEPARVPDTRTCPRVIGATGKPENRLITCGHLWPCPFHGAPLTVVAPLPDAGAGGDE